MGNPLFARTAKLARMRNSSSGQTTLVPPRTPGFGGQMMVIALHHHCHVLITGGSGARSSALALRMRYAVKGRHGMAWNRLAMEPGQVMLTSP
jgi:hypothetical protein